MDLAYIVHQQTWNSSWNSSTNNNRVETSPLLVNLRLTLPYLIIIAVCMVTGSVGNCLVIASVAITKELKNVGNLFIVNLAIADLCVTGFIDPASIAGIVVGENWFLENFWLCDMIGAVCMTSCFCSLLNIGAISFNRYIHICHNAVYNKIFTLRNTIVMCVGLWLISFLGELPNFLGWGDHVYDKKALICVYDRTADYSYTIFFTSVGIVLPMTLISIFYIRIFIFVRNSKKKIEQTRSQTNENAGKEKRESVKLARTLFLIFLTFAICWLPYVITVALDPEDKYPMALHAYTVALAHTSSSLNCILYGITNKQFRNSYIRIIRKCLNRPEITITDGSLNGKPSETTKA